MVTVKPEPTTTTESSAGAEPEWPPLSELRLNLAALGVDHLADDFGERLCQLSSDNPPWKFEYSAQGELIIMAPPGSESSLDDAEITAELVMWRRSSEGMSYGATIGFSLPSGAQRIPGAAWITQERYDNLTPPERRATINGAPDFVVEVRSRTDRLPPFLAKMLEWMDGGARLGWAIDPRHRHVYVYRAGRTEPELLQDPETLSGEDVLPEFTFEVRRLVFDRHTEESES
jgi:Uma2 family endonuclease